MTGVAHCGNCEREISPDARACRYCGAPQANRSATPSSQGEASTEALGATPLTPNQRPGRRGWAIVVVLVVAGGAAVLLGMHAHPRKTASNQTYNGKAFSISYPSGWQVQDAEQSRLGYTDTTIVSPTDQNTLIRVDVTSNPPSSDPMTDAQPVINARQKHDGYQQIDLSTRKFEGFSAVHWEFLDRESGVLVHKEDEFFTDQNGDSVAVLTQASAGNYAGLARQFASVRQTLSMK
jgi:hypothetical protein